MENEEKITYFAETDSRGQKVPFGIKDKDRSRHIYVIGKTGMGKSTLLENMAIQDIKSGRGLAFIDPHGKTAELLLDYVPKERVKDVIYFAPFDLDYPISFNVMEDVGYDKRHLVVSGLMSAFKKIWVDAWSGRMEYILSNTLLALLEYPGATLLGVNRMYVDKEYRKKVVDNIKDPTVRSFWVDEFAKYTDRYTQEATPAIQNKVGQFTSNPLIRNIIGQPKSSFDMREIMDEKKIFIVNLSKGRMGETNANLLGSMIITKIYLAAMSRAEIHEDELQKLPPFNLFVDEFQSFANESFADILSEARKYKLSLVIAHQYIEQMSDEVKAAVFGNVGTMITFRVGAYDAEVLEKEFSPQFTIEDLVNLGFVQIYLKLMIDGVSSSPFSATTLPPIKPQAESLKDHIIEYSRKTYADSRSTVEEKIREWHGSIAEKEGGFSDHKFPKNNARERGGSRENRGAEDKGDRRQRRKRDNFGSAEEERKIKSKLLSEPSQDDPNTFARHLRKKDDTKGPTEESRKSLKEALGDIIKNEKPKAGSPKNEGLSGEKIEEKKSDKYVKEQKGDTEKGREDAKETPKTKEVPEDVLKKILDVDE